MIQIAIDGPAGAGKSTLARQVAHALGFLYVDTGAIYRTLALKAHRMGTDLSDPAQVQGLLAGLDLRMEWSEAGEQRMLLGGEDVSQAIREHHISALASQISAHAAVRTFLLEFQRKQAREHSVVMDGRDIATVVLPNAHVKIFLTAAPEVRARRRLRELEQRGQPADLETVLHDILKRDEQDKTRAISPLAMAEDSILLDTTNLNLDQSLRTLLTLIKERIAQ